ncbi:MAG: nitrous oxide reductase accessory protein NosL [Halobacteriaceae archaeon]
MWDDHPEPSRTERRNLLRRPRPRGPRQPARFDSTWEAFQFDFGRSDWERTAFYVTDYAAVDYEVRTDEGQRLISTHPAAEAFVEADSVTFVAGSEVVGAMGKDLIGFSDAEAAASFRDQYGGSLVTLDEVTRELIASLGM